MEIVVVLEGTLYATDGDDNSDLESCLDRTMEELLELAATDPCVEFDFATGHVQLSVGVNTANPVTAIPLASGIIRTALHAAGVATPDWLDAPSDSAYEMKLRGARTDLADTPEGLGFVDA